MEPRITGPGRIWTYFRMRILGVYETFHYGTTGRLLVSFSFLSPLLFLSRYWILVSVDLEVFFYSFFFTGLTILLLLLLLHHHRSIRPDPTSLFALGHST